MDYHKLGSLNIRDKRILRDSTRFAVNDAKAKTAQTKKDFYNDVRSVAGPDLITNMLKNVLYINRGVFSDDRDYGVDVDEIMFEQLDWSALEFLRGILANDLAVSLHDVNILNVNITIDSKCQNQLNISIEYAVELSNYNEAGARTIGEHVADFTLTYAGVKGEN